jgi:hypothetical protein
MAIEHSNPSGLCQCGCGGKTSLARQNHTERGWIKGTHVQFIAGHTGRKLVLLDRVCEHCGSGFFIRPFKVRQGKGKFCSRKCMHAARTVNAMPYRQSKEHRYQHRAVAARALGRALPAKAQVHHVNGNTLDNRPSNLVICEDSAYHKLLHRRQRILQQGGTL